jgi:hypothetical protein
MRGKCAPECSKPPISPKKSTLGSCKDGECQAQRGYAPVVARGGGFFEKPLCTFAHSGHQDAQTPLSPRVGSEGRAYRGRFLGKPLRAISRFQASGRPDSPFSPCGIQKVGLTGVGFWGSPCVPSPVSGMRTPKLPLLPVWEKGAGGMRGKCAPECSKPLISSKKSTSGLTSLAHHLTIDPLYRIQHALA